MKNIELKVAVDRFDGIVNALKKMGGEHKDTLHQIDTYYNAKSGRIKIREINNRHFELIAYNRPDRANSKISDYKITPLEKEHLESRKAALAKTLGERSVVEKKRDLWILRNTRIHFDKVNHLGMFLELETVVKGPDMNIFKKEHEEIIEQLNLSKYKKYKQSYGELIGNVHRPIASHTASSNKAHSHLPSTRLNLVAGRR